MYTQSIHTNVSGRQLGHVTRVGGVLKRTGNLLPRGPFTLLLLNNEGPRTGCEKGECVCVFSGLIGVVLELILVLSLPPIL